jgi:diaminopimelate decarboxylase
MDHFQYRDGALYCEDVPMEQLAGHVGTPAYVYSRATLVHHYRAIESGFGPLAPLICYSIKCCPNIHICKLLRELGSGFDVVSGGELHRALAAGGDPKKIVFAGVGKTDAEIDAAIAAGIGWFNVESEAEMENLIERAASRGARVKAALRINPDVDPHTHRYTTTGKKETKFGVDSERARQVFARAASSPSVKLCGLHLHLGSPINRVAPFAEAIKKTLGLIDALAAVGHRVEMLDIGGGFGAHYRGEEAPGAAEYGAAIVPLLAGRGLQVVLEPGRAIAANAGILLTRVLYTKRSGSRKFVIVDAGMTELIRPALYEAYHFIWPVKPGQGLVPTRRGEAPGVGGLEAVDVVGPVCESGDFLALDRPLPPLRRGDLVAVFSCGAYGRAMASHYNSRPNAPEVLVEGGAYRVIRRRETYDDLLAAEREPG